MKQWKVVCLVLYSCSEVFKEICLTTSHKYQFSDSRRFVKNALRYGMLFQTVKKVDNGRQSDFEKADVLNVLFVKPNRRIVSCVFKKVIISGGSTNISIRLRRLALRRSNLQTEASIYPVRSTVRT